MDGTRHGWLASLVLCLSLSLSLVPAGTSQSSDDDSPVPARVRALEGGAILQRGREQDRIEVTINTPVFPGDRLEVEGGPLEIQLPDGILIWLNEGSRADLLAVDNSSDESRERAILRLREGALEVAIPGERGRQGDVRIDTPESSVYLMSNGHFRVESARNATTVTSYRGIAELAGDEGSVLVRTGRQSRVETGEAPEDPWEVNTLRTDAFGDWCEERAAAYIAETASEERDFVEEVPIPVRHYVSELDHFGNWQYVSTFGWVWRPTAISVGWRPYYSGYWSWCPRGWTWISYEPWGWLPYHYGRWSWVAATGWVWIPGAVYSGAWVSWAVTPSYAGWCPLDYYNRPAYVSFNYTSVTVNHYGGGWNFLPLRRWGERNLYREIVRADRVPQLHGAITTRTLPHFDPRQARVQPGLVQKAVREVSIRPEAPRGHPTDAGISFRQADRRERGDNRKLVPSQNRPGIARRPSVPAPNQPGGMAPGPGVQRTVPSARAYRTLDPVTPQRPDDRRRPTAADRDSGVRLPREEKPSNSPRVPSASNDPSRRVLNRIFLEGTPAPRSGSGPRATPGGAAKPRVGSDRVGDSPAPRATVPPSRPSPPRPAPPPPRKSEGKKKDKP